VTLHPRGGGGAAALPGISSPNWVLVRGHDAAVSCPHQLNSMGEAPGLSLFLPPRAVAPERGGAEGKPLRRKTLFLAFSLPGWGFGGSLRPHGAGEGLEIEFFGGATAPPIHPRDAGPRFCTLNLMPMGYGLRAGEGTHEVGHASRGQLRARNIEGVAEGSLGEGELAPGRVQSARLGVLRYGG